MSSLDELMDNEYARLNGETLRHLDGMGSRRKRVAAARTELAALRRRVEDYRLLALAAGWHLQKAWSTGKPIGWIQNKAGARLDALPDDGTGLPLLTDEARVALRGPERA